MVAVPRSKSISSGAPVGHKKKEVAPLPPISFNQSLDPPNPDSSSMHSLKPVKGNDLNVDCPFKSEHNDSYKELIEVTIDLSPQEVYNIVFESSEIMLELYKRMNYTDVQLTPWVKNDEHQGETRSLTCTALLPSKVLGPSHSQVKETFTSYEHNRINELYVVHSCIISSGMPYGENFKILTHCCLRAEYESGDATEPTMNDLVENNASNTCLLDGYNSFKSGLIKTRFSFYCQTKFVKHTFFLVKGIIEKSSYEGLQNFIENLVDTLIIESEKRRPKTKLNLSHLNHGNKIEQKPKKKKFNRVTQVENSSPSQSLLLGLAMLFLCTVAAMNIYISYCLKNIELVSPAISKLAELDENQIKTILSALRQDQMINEENNRLDEVEESLKQYFHKLKQRINSSIIIVKKVEKELDEMRSALRDYELELLKMLHRRNHPNT